jgi:serine/threonine-protein kinase RsbW
MSTGTHNVFILKLKSKPKEILKVEKFLNGVNCIIHLGEIQLHNVLVATTEAVNNAIAHGNLRNPKKYVVVVCKATKSSIEIRVHDEGKGVNENTLPDPLDEKNLLHEHGRGVFLMRHLMDSVKFNCYENGCEVVMKLRKRKKDG